MSEHNRMAGRTRGLHMITKCPSTSVEGHPGSFVSCFIGGSSRPLSHSRLYQPRSCLGQAGPD